MPGVAFPSSPLAEASFTRIAVARRPIGLARVRVLQALSPVPDALRSSMSVRAVRAVTSVFADVQIAICSALVLDPAGCVHIVTNRSPSETLRVDVPGVLNTGTAFC